MTDEHTRRINRLKSIIAYIVMIAGFAIFILPMAPLPPFDPRQQSPPLLLIPIGAVMFITGFILLINYSGPKHV